MVNIRVGDIILAQIPWNYKNSSEKQNVYVTEIWEEGFHIIGILATKSGKPHKRRGGDSYFWHGEEKGWIAHTRPNEVK